MNNLYHAYKPIGKVVYYINGQRFCNTSSQEKDGKQKALKYCELNNLDTAKIIKFDSELECDRYEYLLEEERKGNIKYLEFHKVITLIPEFVNNNGDIIPAQTYNCDFVYMENGKVIYEDTKGMSLLMDTRFELAKALFDYKYKESAYIRIVIRRDGEWKEWHIGDKKKPTTAKQKRLEKARALKKELHDKEVEQKKIERIKALYVKYRDLPKLTKKQKEKFIEYQNYLKEKGVIL